MVNVPKEEWEQMRDELRDLRTAVNALTTALTGNELGTTGIQPRLAAAEVWINEAKVKLALIAAGIAGGATGLAEAVKAYFSHSDK